MSGAAIEFSGVSKKYRRHTQPRATTLKSFLLYDLWNRREIAPNVTWALRDIDLTIKKGITLGVVGRNGSGKSTLLKLVSRILKPDRGSLTIDGKVTALIELGAGFHPELTGRENIMINGIILGLTQDEIKTKMDEIIRFSEVGGYVDDPVRTYSSGMYMRLGFSVAIHVNPEILLIDEVLSVGDAAFTHKCIDKMNAFQKEGKTIILVTHDLGMVRSWCNEAIWMDGGCLRMKGDPENVVEAYTRAMCGA